ncbi:phage tail spike protein [Enterococcus hailinensis]|uniref:phage tail spike protein n=1 Tax=Enterococcus hailinensis TaxID=3238988 RepID=UPI0038B2C18A
MDFYFTDRQFELQEIVSTNTSTAIVMAGEEDKLSIENGSRTLTGTLYFTNKQSAQVKVAAAIGNYILYHDKNEKDVWMTIVEIEHNPLNGTHTFVAEDAGLDLLNELVGPYKADKAYNIAYYINKFTFDSGFEIGFNEIPSLTRKLEWDSEDSTALARVLSVATQFDNTEVEFSFSVENTTVLKKYINIYKKRGKDNRQTLYVNVDVNNIVVKSDIYELATAIYAQGGTPDGKNSPINLKGYKWTDPNGRYELTASSGILKDKENGAKWSRLLPGQANPNGAYILRRKSYETTNQKTLLDNTLRELKKISDPAINYEVDIADLPEGINIGDTIYLVDENEEVYLSARVLELSFMYSTNSYTAVLGDYLIKQSGVSQSLNELANDLKDQANRKKYDVKLEATAQAFVDKKGTITIVAKVFDGTLDVSTNFSEYKWSRIDSEGIADPDWTNITNTVTISADDQPLWTYSCEVSNQLEDGILYAIGSDRLTITNLSNGVDGNDAILLNITSVNGNIFKNTGVSTVLTVAIIVGETRIETSEQLLKFFGSTAYLQWQIKRVGELEFTNISRSDPHLSDEGFLFTIGVKDIEEKATFNCILDY